ncbi:hypothetical protein GW932_00390 [archaeon]|nr:hypothetical protein [archaeon]
MNKKLFIFSGIIIILVLALVSTFLFQDKTYSNEEVLEIVHPEIKNYCFNLDEKAIFSHCNICKGYYKGNVSQFNYVKVGDFEDIPVEQGVRYILEQRGNNYNIELRVPIIAGRNDRPAGYSKLSFELDKEGKIINSNIPEINECVSQ